MTKLELRAQGRAKNAMLAFFERKLSVPRIYMDAEWTGKRVDVLAIDRDGVGDVHGVLLFSRTFHVDGTLNFVNQGEEIERLLIELEQIPANWKYLVAVDRRENRREGLGLSQSNLERTFAPDGIGRVGILLIDFLNDEEDPRPILVVKPERFRAKVAALADEFVEKHTADWEIRA